MSVRFSVFLIFWLVLDGVKPAGILIGLPAAALAGLISVRLLPPSRSRPRQGWDPSPTPSLLRQFGTLWPVLAGIGLFIVLRRWFNRLPGIPSGNVVVLGGGVSHAAAACGAAITKADGFLRLWTIACIALLAIIVALLVAMLARS